MTKDTNDYQYWGKTADSFDAASKYILGAKTQETAKTWLKDQLLATDVVLEIGCGTGFFSGVIAEKVQHLTATDMSQEMLAKTRARLHAFSNVDVQTADGYKTQFAAQCMDVVFMGNVVHIITEPTAMLREAQRVLKPGGRLLLIDYTMEGMAGVARIRMIIRYLRQYGMPPKANKNYSLEEFAGLLQGLDLTIRDVQLLKRETSVLCLCAISNGK